jgi:uncharacterized protein YbaR (Trm112 family)
LDTLKIKKKQEEENATMSIYCPRCRRKHSSRECLPKMQEEAFLKGMPIR